MLSTHFHNYVVRRTALRDRRLGARRAVMLGASQAAGNDVRRPRKAALRVACPLRPPRRDGLEMPHIGGAASPNGRSGQAILRATEL